MGSSAGASAERLLALLSLLQSRPRWNATELAERLGIDRRTVRRDVTRLRDLGYPVVAEAGPHGGYQLGAGGSLPPLLLDDDEAVAVAIGLRAAAGGGVAGLDDAAVAALAKLEQVLPVRLRERVRSLHQATDVLGPVGRESVHPDLLLTLAQGCRRMERLRFAYRDRDGNETERRVEPYRLVHTGSRWYLVACDLDRDAWRTFRVDRVSEAALAGHRFTRTSEPDAAAMVADGIAVAGHPWQAEVLLHVDPAEAAETIPRTVGTIEPCDGGTLLRIGADDLDWIARYLAGLPFDFEVRHPPELRKELRTLGRRLQRSHPSPRSKTRSLVTRPE
jgi:predicted DNA-binding transcriptional regulator YafY